MHAGTGKRTATGTKKYTRRAGQREKEKKKEGKIKMQAGSETKSRTEQGEELSNIYSINIKDLFLERKRRTRESEVVKANTKGSTQDKKKNQRYWTERKSVSWIEG